MMTNSIQFFAEGIDFKLAKSKKVAAWLHDVATSHDSEIGELCYIFVSDEHLLGMNIEFLQHDTYTDIITFPHPGNSAEDLLGDMFISIDRVRENAESFGVTFETELRRVLVHGLLHLIGFDDKDEESVVQMRAAEEAGLALAL